MSVEAFGPLLHSRQAPVTRLTISQNCFIDSDAVVAESDAKIISRKRNLRLDPLRISVLERIPQSFLRDLADFFASPRIHNPRLTLHDHCRCRSMSFLDKRVRRQLMHEHSERAL